MARLLQPNLADEKRIITRCTEELVPLIRHVRRDRKTLRETWLRYLRIWGAVPGPSGPPPGPAKPISRCGPVEIPTIPAPTSPITAPALT